MNNRHKNCSIATNTQGATIIEYAIVLPVLLLMVMSIVEYCLILYASSVLEGALIYAARAGSTGYQGSSDSRQQYIYGLVQQRVSGLLDTTQLSISSQSYANLSGINVSTPCINPVPPAVPICPNDVGSPGSIVVYTAAYPWTVVTPILQNIIGSASTYMIYSAAIVKNEPFPEP